VNFKFRAITPAVGTSVRLEVPFKAYTFTGSDFAVGTSAKISVPMGTFAFNGFNPHIWSGIVPPVHCFPFSGSSLNG